MREIAEKSQAGSPTKNAHRLFVSGVVVSAIYVVGMLAYAWRMRHAVLDMAPDEFATFLSGVFAPLAFLWLVLGFRQQGDELQNSARALWLQGEELRNSVEQQRQLVEVSREQLEAERAARLDDEEAAERAAQPGLFMLDVGGSYSGPQRTLYLVVQNAGPRCSAVEYFVGPNLRESLSLLEAGGRVSAQMHYDTPDKVEPLVVTVRYTDGRGNRRAQSFEIPVDETGGAYRDRTLGKPKKIPGFEKLT